MISALAGASRLLNRMTEMILAPIVAGFILVVVAAVVSRYVFHLPFTTGTELTRIGFVWACFLGAAVGVRRLAHIRVTFVMARLPERLRDSGLIATFISTAVLAALMIYHGLHLTNRMSVTYFPTLQISQAWLYAVLPVSGALMLLHAAAGLAELLSGRFVPPPSMLPEQ